MTTAVDDVNLKLPSSGVRDLFTSTHVEPLLPLPSRPKNDLAYSPWKPESELFPNRQHSHVHNLADKCLPVDQYAIPSGLGQQNQRTMHPVGEDVVGYRPTKQVHTSIKDEHHTHLMSETYQAMNLAMVPCRVIPPFGTGRNIETSHSHLISPRAKLQAPSYGSAASKANSSDQHKLSEKRRRDGMGAFIQAAEIMRGDLNPGRLSGCSICQEDGDFFGNRITSFIVAESLGGPGGPGGLGAKKTKNDMVSDGLMWVFSVVLHLYPAEIGKRLDNIRACADQMAKEKEFGLLNDPRSKKWPADIRADVLGQILRTMEFECEKHGVDIGRADTALSPPEGCIITPSSSISAISPTIGQKRSWDVSVEAQEDGEPRTKLPWPPFSLL